MSRGRSSSLYVRNLPDGSRHEDLRRIFGKYGRIYDVTIPLDYYTGRMKGFAFVEYPFHDTFEDIEDAEEAQYRLDKTRFLGREIEIEFTRGTRKTPADMRGKDRGGRRDDRRGYGGGGRRRSRSPMRGGRRSRSRSRSVSRRRSPSPARNGSKSISPMPRRERDVSRSPPPRMRGYRGGSRSRSRT